MRIDVMLSSGKIGKCKNLIGNAYFQLLKEYAPKAYITSHERLMEKDGVEMHEGVYQYLEEFEDSIELSQNDFITVADNNILRACTVVSIENKPVTLSLNNDFYNYFVKMGCTFRIKQEARNGQYMGIVQLVKKGKVIGFVLPIRMNEDHIGVVINKFNGKVA